MKPEQISKDPLTRAYNWARREYARRRMVEDLHCSHTAADVMAEAEKRYQLGTFGVEGFAINMDSGVEYLNTGDSYGRTILFRSRSRWIGRWSLGAWGDIAERLKK